MKEVRLVERTEGAAGTEAGESPPVEIEPQSQDSRTYHLAYPAESLTVGRPLDGREARELPFKQSVVDKKPR
jgi:hypothetical protein